MTVGDKIQIKAKTLQGQEIKFDLIKTSTTADAKAIIAKKMNEKVNTESGETKLHPAQIRLTFNESNLEDDVPLKDVDDIEDGFVYVFVDDASKIPITVKIHVFKGTGVDHTTVDCTLGDNALTLKNKLIAQNFGPQEPTYTLFYKGRPLMDKKQLMDYGVEDGAEILLGVIMS